MRAILVHSLIGLGHFMVGAYLSVVVVALGLSPGILLFLPDDAPPREEPSVLPSLVYASLSPQDLMLAVRFPEDAPAGALVGAVKFEPESVRRSDVPVAAVDAELVPAIGDERLGRPCRKGEVFLWTDLPRFDWGSLGRVPLDAPAGAVSRWEVPIDEKECAAAAGQEGLALRLWQDSMRGGEHAVPFDDLVLAAQRCRWAAEIADRIGTREPDPGASRERAERLLAAAQELEATLRRELRIAQARDRGEDAAEIAALLRRLYPVDAVDAPPWERTGFSDKARGLVRLADETYAGWSALRRSSTNEPVEPGGGAPGWVIATRSIVAGDRLQSSDLETGFAGAAAVPQGAVSAATASALLGRRAARDVRPGAILTREDVGPP